MIQRIQTVWLLLASTAMALTFKFSFFTGNKIVKTPILNQPIEAINASSNFIGLILAIAFASICFITIFMFKNRKLQMKLVALCILVGLINLYLLYYQTNNFTNGTYSISAIFPVMAIGFAISALHSVWKDEKKIKELNSSRIR
jgi:peptidoglycan/LPS O-acetylase OafA/YrhL